jgi:hypothetical protein
MIYHRTPYIIHAGSHSVYTERNRFKPKIIPKPINGKTSKCVGMAGFRHEHNVFWGHPVLVAGIMCMRGGGQTNLGVGGIVDRVEALAT